MALEICDIFQPNAIAAVARDVVSSKYLLSSRRKATAARTLVAAFLSMEIKAGDLESGRTCFFVSFTISALPRAVSSTCCGCRDLWNGVIIWPGMTTCIVGIVVAASKTVYCWGVTLVAILAKLSAASPYALWAFANLDNMLPNC